MKKIVVICNTHIIPIMTEYPNRAGFDSTEANRNPRAEIMKRKVPRTIMEIGRHCSRNT